MRKYSLAALALSFVFLTGAAIAQNTPTADLGFTDKQKEQIEAVVKDLLTNKDPGLVMTAVKNFQARQEEETTKKAREALAKNKDKLVSDKDPFIGNPKGDVTIVEFFDYNCGYCKKATPTIHKLVEEDKNVKVVYKQFPILAESSRTAAKYALAAQKQGKYADYHVALMDHKGPLNDEALNEIADKLKLDKDKLKKDAAAPEIEVYLNVTQDLGRELGARGTPTFIIGDKLVPGAIEIDELKKLVADARAAAPAKK